MNMKIGIYSNEHKDNNLVAAKALINILNKKGISYSFSTNAENVDIKGAIPLQDLSNDSDIVIAFGGDGTMLNVISYIDDKAIPILGVNMGKIGFLTEIDKDNLEKAEAAFESEDYEQANAYSKASLSALDGVKEVTPLPEFYVVKPWAETKDCYWNISGRPYVYNNPLLWENLYQANKSNMPKPEDPNLIHPGMKMKIPSLTGEYRSGTYDPKKSYSTYGE